MQVAMGRLFWKFFLGFWIALVTVAGSVAAGVWLARWFDLIPVSAAEARRAEVVLSVTSGLLASHDTEGLKRVAELFKRAGKPPPYLLDAQGHDLLGRMLDPQLVAKVLAAPEQTDLKHGGDSLGLIEHTPTASGQAITVFMPADTLRSTQGPLERTPPPVWIPILATLLISTLFATFAAWHVSHRIHTLQAAFRRLADGQLDTRVSMPQGRRHRRRRGPENDDEMVQLGADFNRMAQQLQQLVGAQQRLLHDVSHELRSPLARMQAAIGLARQQPERMPAMHERVERECMRLDALVGEVLTLARMETTQAQPPRLPIDVVALMAEVCNDARFEARAAHRDLQFSAQGSFVAEVNAELLCRAFENVVRNAVKFTREATSVQVTAEASSTALLITVQDQGPGVPEEARTRMFEPFERLGEAGVEGFGLGLTIAKRAIESHGGRIEAHAPEGGGLAVVMRLGARG
ncbi:ATP-binding protein [Ideonella azotifigens]|nr:ATP-binding protein [Ideonella azotifigens]MCD2339207.1 ATP-binding protein [Ideonella azotifigens]